MKKSALLLTLLLIIWVLVDLFIPRKGDFRHFEPGAVARLDAAMWRSYYEQKPVRLGWQSARLLREQVHAPFWRSFVMSYHAAKAAFVFKDGKTRADYNRALPNLEAFYAHISRLSSHPIDVGKAARNELEWWIIRRERDRHPPQEWADLQAKIAADLYQIPMDSCARYSQLRTEAMRYRDQKGDAMTEADWQWVQQRLEQAWQALSTAITRTKDDQSARKP